MICHSLCVSPGTAKHWGAFLVCDRVVRVFLSLGTPTSSVFHGLIRKLNKKLRMAMLRIVKNVSDGFIMGEDLAMFIPDLVEHLPPISSSGRDHDPETMRTRVVLTQALFNICRFDVKRSESAYLHGVLPHLMHFTERFSNSGLCTLSMTLICEQAQYQSREVSSARISYAVSYPFSSANDADLSCRKTHRLYFLISAIF